MDVFSELEQAHRDLDAIKAILSDYGLQKKATEKKIEGLEEKALSGLLEDKEQGSVGRIVGNTVYSLMRVNPKPIITDESKIPDKFWKIEKSIKKAELNQAIKDGEVIEGVMLDNGGYTITRKANLKG